MPKFTCRCGHRFDLSTIPNPEGLRVAADAALDKVPENHSAAELMAVLDEEGWDMYRCPDCGRVAVFWDQKDPKPTFYVPEPTG